MSPNDEVLTGVFSFSNLGRNKKCFAVQLNGEQSLFDAIKPHLMSKDFGYDFDMETNEGKIYVGGFREIGKFKKVTKESA